MNNSAKYILEAILIGIFLTIDIIACFYSIPFALAGFACTFVNAYMLLKKMSLDRQKN